MDMLESVKTAENQRERDQPYAWTGRTGLKEGIKGAEDVVKYGRVL